MGFVKGMITGVLAIAGIFVGAAIVDVIKDEKKENDEMKKAADEVNKMTEEDDKVIEEGLRQFHKHVGNKLEKMAASA